MTKTFWRVDYEGGIDKEMMLEGGKLAWPRELSADDRRKFGKQIRAGHGVVLAKLRGKSGLGEAIGRVTEVKTHPIRFYEISVEWKEVPKFRLKPDASGLRRWQKYPILKFAAVHAQRYKLAELLEEHLGDTSP